LKSRRSSNTSRTTLFYNRESIYSVTHFRSNIL
jgi:hypothetical protein